MAETTERIPQHRHCAACGNAFLGKGKFCSEECMDLRKKEVGKKKKGLILVWLLVLGTTVALVAYMLWAS